MIKKEGFLSFAFTYAAICAIVYAIPVMFFFNNPDFSNMWLLYLGSALFLMVMMFAIIKLNKKYGENVKTNSLVLSGHIITLMGVGLTLLIMLLLILINMPEVFSSAPVQDPIVDNKPANTNTPLFMLMLSAIVGNFSAGSFPSIIIPYATKRNQKTERGTQVVQDPMVNN